MSRSLDDLTPEFHLKVVELMQNCQVRGVVMVPYVTLRSPHEQAELWRQSRTVREVLDAVTLMKNNGAPWLAGIMSTSTPVTGREVTRALPGNGWHQFGEACDFYWEVNSAANWDGEGGQGYMTLAAEAAKIGLTSGRGWTNPDYDHVQLRPQAAPDDLYSWADIDAKMRQQFGGQP